MNYKIVTLTIINILMITLQALADSTESDFLSAREKRDKALSAVASPINELYRKTLQELLRRAKEDDESDTAKKIQYELQMLDSGGSTPIADAPSTHGLRRAEPDLAQQLADTKWRLTKDKTFVLNADGTSTSNWTPRKGHWRVVGSDIIELSIMNVPRTERVKVQQGAALLIWLNKEADEEHPQVAKKIQPAE